VFLKFGFGGAGLQHGTPSPTRCTPVLKGCAKPEGLITKEATDFGFKVWLALKALGNSWFG